MTDEPETEYRQPRFAAPLGATQVVLVRHGESAPHRPGESFPMVDGHGDPPLAPDGEAQARLVGERLSVEAFDAIYVTTLQRTVQTAAPLAEALGIEPSVEPELREVFLGEWEGGSFRQHMAQGHPIARELMESGRWEVIPGAERGDDFSRRVVGALNRLHERHPDGRIAVFTHGGVIAAAVAHAVGVAPMRFAGSENGSIHHLVILDGTWILRTWNDVSHLGPLTGAQPRQIRESRPSQ